MNKKEYLEIRNKYLNEAKNLINEGKFEDAENKKVEIENLDERFEQEAKAIANLSTLENKTVIAEPQNSIPQTAVQTVENIQKVENNIKYEDVFAKYALGNRLEGAEIEVFNKYNPENAYTHDTTNTEIVIPQTVVGGIMKMAEEAHPFFRDVKKYNIKGYVRFLKHTGVKAGDAKHYKENQVVEDEQNDFGEIELKGFEIAKSVTVSWKLQAMAISEFVPFLQAELGERIGAVMGNAVINGDGTTAPKGVLKFLEAYNSKSQIVDYKKPIDYTAITQAISKLGGRYTSGAKFYVNNSTIWNVLANILDNNGRPIFIADPSNGGVGRLFGIVVESEDSIADNEMLLGNANQGYVVNFNEGLKLVTENHAKPRTTDFVGFGIYDGGCLDETAFVHLKGTAKA